MYPAVFILDHNISTNSQSNAYNFHQYVCKYIVCYKIIPNLYISTFKN